MPDCQTIDPLVTSYVDGELAPADRRLVDEHLVRCPPCHARVAAERAVHDLIQERKPTLSSERASSALHDGCRHIASRARAEVGGAPAARTLRGGVRWRERLVPLAMAASLVLIVGAAFLYQLTASSTRVMAAELAADHVKCFAMNGVLHTHHDAAAVESSMLSYFGWQMRVPDGAAKAAGLELVGARPCLYGEGKVAHIMYRHNGQPVSLFMLPQSERQNELVQVLGHNAAVWCIRDRTFVLLTREPRESVQRLATLMETSLK